MKRVATGKDEAIVRIADEVRMTVVRVEPTIIVVVFDIEHVEVAI